MRRHGQDEEDSAGPFIRAPVPAGSRSDTPVRESLTSRDRGGIGARRALRDLPRAPRHHGPSAAARSRWTRPLSSGS